MQDRFEKYRELGYNCAPAGATSPCRDKQGFVDVEYVEEYFARHRHGAQEGIYDEHGNPRIPIIRKIKEINSALYEHVLNPPSDDDLAESEAMFLSRIALSRQSA